MIDMTLKEFGEDLKMLAQASPQGRMRGCRISLPPEKGLDKKAHMDGTKEAAGSEEAVRTTKAVAPTVGVKASGSRRSRTGDAYEAAAGGEAAETGGEAFPCRAAEERSADRQETLRRAVVWGEILGEPVCKKRKRKRYGC